MFDDDERDTEILKKHSVPLHLPLSLTGTAASVVQIDDIERANFATPRLLLRLKSLSARNSSARALGSVRPLGEFLSQLLVTLTGAMAGSGGVRTTSTTSSQCSGGVEDRTLHSARAAMVSARDDLVLEQQRTGRELVIFISKVDVGSAEAVTTTEIQCFTVSMTIQYSPTY